MVLFINDIRLTIYKPDEQPASGQFNHKVDASVEPITSAGLLHHVWIQNADVKDMNVLLELLNSQVPLHVLSVHLSVQDYDRIQDFLYSKFKVIKAAGGLVRKKDKFLMIYRLKKWDLPKGKKEQIGRASGRD